MKFLAFSALILSFSAMAACPNLSGTYSACRSNTGEMTSGPTFSQQIVDGVTVYTVDSIDDESGAQMTETFVADGQIRSVTETDSETGMVLTTTSQVTCTANGLTIRFQVSSQNEQFADLLLNITKKGTQMTAITSGATMGEQVNETEVCE